MNIEYEIKRIKNKGLGIVTKQFIPKDHIIWVFKNDRNLISIKDDDLNNYLNQYSGDKIIDILDHMYCFNKVCYDITNSDVKYTNHSNNPTSYIDMEGNSVATRDIFIGEEITEDYKLYDNYLENYYKLMQKYKGDNWSEIPSNWE